MAAKLTAVNKVKVESEKTNAAAAEAGEEEAEAARIDDKESSLSGGMNAIEGNTVTTAARISALQSQLKDAQAAAKKNANAEYEAANVPPGGTAKKAAVILKQKDELGEATEHESKIIKSLRDAKKKFQKSKETYRGFHKTKEAAKKKYELASGEGSIKMNAKKRDQLKQLEESMNRKASTAQRKYDNAKSDHEAAEIKVSDFQEMSTSLIKKIAKLKKQKTRLQEAKDREQGFLNDEVKGTDDHTEQKMAVLAASSKLAKVNDQLDKAEKDQELNDRGLKGMAKPLKKSKERLQGLKSELESYKKSERVAHAKFMETEQFDAKNQLLKNKFRKEAKSFDLSKAAWEDAREKMEQLGEDVKEAGREKETQKLAVRDAVSDLELQKHADANREESTNQAIKDQENIRVLKKKLSHEENKMMKLKAQASTDKSEQTYLEKLKQQKDDDAKAAAKAAAAAMKREQATAQKAESSETAATQKEADETQNFKSEEEQVAEMVKDVDIPKLVARSKAVLAKQILQSQGKPAPVFNPAEVKTEKEKIDEKKKQEEAQRVADEEEKRAIQEMKDAKKDANSKAREEMANEQVQKVDDRKKVRQAMNNKRARYEAANADVSRVRSELFATERELSSAQAKWEITVASGDAHKTHAVGTEIRGLKNKVVSLRLSLKDARRNAEDELEAGRNEVQEAKIAAEKNVEAHRTKVTAALEKSKLEVEQRAQAAEAAGNAQAAVLPTQKGDWMKMYKNIVSNAKETSNSIMSGKAPPGKPRSVERAEKTQAIVQKADAVVKKLKSMEDAKKSAAPATGATADQIAQQEKTRELAKTAEDKSKAAAAAAKQVADLTLAVKSADPAKTAALQSQLAAAKKVESDASAGAEESVEAAKTSSQNSGAEGKKMEEKAEAMAAQEKLKADSDAAKGELEAEKAKAAAAAAEAKVNAAAADADAAAKSGDSAAAEKAAQKMTAAKTAENAEAINAQVAAANAGTVDNEATKAAAAGAAATELEKVGIDNMPEVRSLHDASVTQIAKEHFQELIGGGE